MLQFGWPEKENLPAPLLTRIFLLPVCQASDLSAHYVLQNCGRKMRFVIYPRSVTIVKYLSPFYYLTISQADIKK
ncbi:hypothetical protein [Erwinia tasmaniensis]|uniref:hypothetical protein n=1 Tax=Erwinia tasmaniensis TaxID=338565 RepID=UPI003A4DC4E1